MSSHIFERKCGHCAEITQFAIKGPFKDYDEKRNLNTMVTCQKCGRDTSNFWPRDDEETLKDFEVVKCESSRPFHWRKVVYVPDEAAKQPYLLSLKPVHDESDSRGANKVIIVMRYMRDKDVNSKRMLAALGEKKKPAAGKIEKKPPAQKRPRKIAAAKAVASSE